MTSLRAQLLALVVLPVAATAQVRVTASGSDVSRSEVQAVASLARQGLSRLSQFFPGTPSREIRIVVHADADGLLPDLRRSLHPGVPGLALLQRDEIHLVMADIRVDPPNDLRTTVDHELVHILLDQFVGRNGSHVARWFHEGLAQNLAGGGYLGVQEEDLVYRVHARNYIPFHRLEHGFPKDDSERLALAYGQSYSFVSFLRRTVGLETLLAAARNCGPKTTFRAAFATIMRQGLVVYEDKWLDYILHESGAGYRVILRNCFFILLLVLAGPLLALAVARRRNREERIKKRLGEQDRVEDDAWAAAEAERGHVLEDAAAHPAAEDAGFANGGFEEDEFEDDEFQDDEFQDGESEDEDFEYEDDDEVDWDDWKTDPDDPDFEGRRDDV